jgi:hypothetical protein
MAEQMEFVVTHPAPIGSLLRQSILTAFALLVLLVALLLLVRFALPVLFLAAHPLE